MEDFRCHTACGRRWLQRRDLKTRMNSFYLKIADIQDILVFQYDE